MNRYAKIIERIKGSNLSRAEMATIGNNAQAAIARGDQDAQAVIDAITIAAPTDRYIVFMGFCPGADIRNRLDLDWKARGICTFEFYSSKRQMDRFREVCVGDLIVLKKIQQYGKTMLLSGHGRVLSLDKSEKGDRMLRMQWSQKSVDIEVPLMACNDTVNLREMAKVEAAMPRNFWEWLQN